MNLRNLLPNVYLPIKTYGPVGYGSKIGQDYSGKRYWSAHQIISMWNPRTGHVCSRHVWVSFAFGCKVLRLHGSYEDRYTPRALWGFHFGGGLDTHCFHKDRMWCGWEMYKRHGF